MHTIDGARLMQTLARAGCLGQSRHHLAARLHKAACHRRHVVTLAIESSCDDSCVAIVETSEKNTIVHFDRKITAAAEFKGIHPLVALKSHHNSLAGLVADTITHLPSGHRPDLVSVTRGPGMRSNLAVGLELAKGLSVAWDRPLVGVHHMQAHLLTPRLLSATSKTSQLAFPFLSLLVSGAHTLLVASSSVTEHTCLASTADIAIGNMLDRAARLILPSESPSFRGPDFEAFAFPDPTRIASSYVVPTTHTPKPTTSRYGWALSPPLTGSRRGHSSTSLAFSFSGLLSAAERAMTLVFDGQSGRPTHTPRTDTVSIQERRDLARELQRIAFEHLATRLLIYLDGLSPRDLINITTLVVSGGVAANSFLRHILRCALDCNGYSHIRLAIPPIAMCTDNAAMIAWAGLEMWNQGWESELGIEPIKEWSLDTEAADGGILGVGGWQRRLIASL